MKKNKTIAYMLAATLLVGGTFVGTKAWFTASDEVGAQSLVISTGSLGLEATESEWSSIDSLTEVTEGTTDSGTQTYSNAKPGDDFVKTITITGTGDIDRTLEANGGKINNLYTNDLDVTITTKSGQNITDIGTYLNNKEKEGVFEETFTIQVTIKDTVQEQSKTYDLNNVITALKIDANQKR